MDKGLSLKEIGEFGLIDYFKKIIKLDRRVLRGIGEDAAVVSYTKKKYLLFTTDMLIEDIHFKIKEATPYEIGWKALGCSLSDIASMGGRPLYALVSIGVPEKTSFNFIRKIYQGINGLADIFKVKIVGGDTNRAERLIIDVFLVGEVEKGKVVYRKGAKLNDVIAVTGSLGNSYKSKKHLRFVPRIKEARFLINNFKINAMIDLSDGLSSDLFHILKENKKGAIIFKEEIPLSPKASFEQALHEGEDFELLFTLTEKEAGRISAEKKRINFPISFIGKIIEGEKMWLYSKKGDFKAIEPQGFRHF
ncbi:MAG: thiamine-phosphate kinase [Candidatus Omnitrophota bacterium]